MSVCRAGSLVAIWNREGTVKETPVKSKHSLRVGPPHPSSQRSSSGRRAVLVQEGT